MAKLHVLCKKIYAKNSVMSTGISGSRKVTKISATVIEHFRTYRPTFWNFKISTGKKKWLVVSVQFFWSRVGVFFAPLRQHTLVCPTVETQLKCALKRQALYLCAHWGDNNGGVTHLVYNYTKHISLVDDMLKNWKVPKTHHFFLEVS